MIPSDTILLLSFAAALIKLAVSAYVYLNNPKAKINILFSMLFLSQSIWDLGKGFMWLSQSKEAALMYGKISYAGYIISVFLFAHFCWTYLKRKNFFSRSAFGLTLWYAPMIALVAALFTSSLVIKDLAQPGTIPITFGLDLWMYLYGPLYTYFFFVFQMLPFLYGFFIFISKYAKSHDDELKKRLKYLIIGTSFPIIIGIPTGVLLPFIGIQLPPHNNLLSLIMSIFIAIGILKYKLLSVTSSLEKPNPNIDFPEEIRKANISYGSSYLIENPDSDETAYLLFINAVYKGSYGFIISSQSKGALQQRYSLSSTQIVTITDAETEESALGTTDLEQIFATAESFIKSTKHGLLIIDCIDLLANRNNFHKIQFFLRHLNMLLKENDACLIVPSRELRLSKKESLVLRTEFTYVTAKGSLAALTGSMIDLYQTMPRRERYIVVGYTPAIKALLQEFAESKTPCSIITDEALQANALVKIVHGDPLQVLKTITIPAAASIIISFAGDAQTILAINLIRHQSSAAKIVALVNSEKFVEIAKKAGANEVIAISSLGGKLLSLSLTSPNVVEWFMDSLTSRNRSIDLKEVSLDTKSKLIGKTLYDIDTIFGTAAKLLAVSKRGTADLTSEGSYRLQEHDKIIALIHHERVKKNPAAKQLFS